MIYAAYIIQFLFDTHLSFIRLECLYEIPQSNDLHKAIASMYGTDIIQGNYLYIIFINNKIHIYVYHFLT
jgi:hypothetical protein